MALRELMYSVVNVSVGYRQEMHSENLSFPLKSQLFQTEAFYGSEGCNAPPCLCCCYTHTHTHTHTHTQQHTHTHTHTHKHTHTHHAPLTPKRKIASPPLPATALHTHPHTHTLSHTHTHTHTLTR